MSRSANPASPTLFGWPHPSYQQVHLPITVLARVLLYSYYYLDYNIIQPISIVQANFEINHHQSRHFSRNLTCKINHSTNSHKFDNFYEGSQFISIFYNLPQEQMSIQSNPRKWTNQFIQECAALYPATTRYSLKHRYPSSRTSASMSQLRQNSSSQIYSSSASSLYKYDGSEVTRATQQMENSLSRLSCVKCKHAEQCIPALKKKGKENWKQPEKEQKYVVANVQAMPVQAVTNTIHTVQTIFIPTPPQIVQHNAQMIYSQPAQTICLQGSPFQIQRPVSAPKLNINYFSPPSSLIRSQPTVIPFGLSVFR